MTVEGILSAVQPLHYRNKSQYPVSADGARWVFTRPAAIRWSRWSCCRIQKPQADAAAEALRRYIRECGVPCLRRKDTGRGLVRHLYVRTNSAGQSLVCVLVNGRKLPREDDAGVVYAAGAAERRGRGAGREHPAAPGLYWAVNTAPCGARTCWRIPCAACRSG